MKTENTPEAKKRFFDLYRRLKVGHWGDIPNDAQFYVLESRYSHSDFCLLLTPVSQISDEDAIQVARILYPDIKSFHKIERGKEFIRVFTATNHRRYLYDPIATVKVYNFLISRGYYVGDGTEIEYGWAKLKTT